MKIKLTLIKINIKKKEKELEEKTKELLKDYLTLKFYKKYYKFNDENPERKLQKNIEFPFDIIKFDNKADIKIKPKEDSTRYLILSNSKFVHLNPYDIIKRSIFPFTAPITKQNSKTNSKQKKHQKYKKMEKNQRKEKHQLQNLYI